MDPSGTILVATRDEVVRLDGQDDVFRRVRGLDDLSPTCLAALPGTKGPVWCGTTDAGVYRSDDGGRSWRSPMEGLEVGYLRSVALAPDDPTAVVVSAASKARSAYAAFRADGRLYRREGEGAWRRVRHGWPEPPDTIAPLLLSDAVGRRILAADERGVHASSDRGVRWETLARFGEEPAWLRGLAVL